MLDLSVLFLIRLIDLAARLLILAVVVDVVLHYFTSPYHPVRAFLDRIVLPLLRPIQRVVPPLGGLDFSPIVLILLIQVLAQALTSVLASLV